MFDGHRRRGSSGGRCDYWQKHTEQEKKQMPCWFHGALVSDGGKFWGEFPASLAEQCPAISDNFP
ncbi:MAG TPA: hypothetical protein DEB17_05415 [Chlorobaculum sp.]|uniref:Uncharacterized protein n=1 Tax=Chlorobaculum tepidum (strain ATCC 49652 / DSM 12025 / NBRC 103806 / TLS) TaxID=194439 RepID=Q8KAR3_CHLTE|nr:hypothetical protein CT2093 [Chlorobaculum tepidum TLS]HBU23424.1 hypothetical protein [Chlorobaculum sp.]